MKTESFAKWIPPILPNKAVYERRSDGRLWACNTVNHSNTSSSSFGNNVKHLKILYEANSKKFKKITPTILRSTTSSNTAIKKGENQNKSVLANCGLDNLRKPFLTSYNGKNVCNHSKLITLKETSNTSMGIPDTSMSCTFKTDRQRMITTDTIQISNNSKKSNLKKTSKPEPANVCTSSNADKYVQNKRKVKRNIEIIGEMHKKNNWFEKPPTKGVQTENGKQFRREVKPKVAKKSSSNSNTESSILPLLEARSLTFSDNDIVYSVNIIELPLTVSRDDITTSDSGTNPETQQNSTVSKNVEKSEYTKYSNGTSKCINLGKKYQNKKTNEYIRNKKKSMNQQLLEEYQMSWGFPASDEEDSLNSNETVFNKCTQRPILSTYGRSCINDMIAKTQTWSYRPRKRSPCCHNFVKTSPSKSKSLQRVACQKKRVDTANEWNWDRNMSGSDSYPTWLLNLIEGHYTMKYKYG